MLLVDASRNDEVGRRWLGRRGRTWRGQDRRSGPNVAREVGAAHGVSRDDSAVEGNNVSVAHEEATGLHVV